MNKMKNELNYHLLINELRNVNNEIIKHSGYEFWEDNIRKDFKIDLKNHYPKLNLKNKDLELILEYINKNEKTEIVGFSYDIIKRKYVKEILEIDNEKVEILRIVE